MMAVENRRVIKCEGLVGFPPGQVAQLVERSPEKAGVGGSIPSLATTYFQRLSAISVSAEWLPGVQMESKLGYHLNSGLSLLAPLAPRMWWPSLSPELSPPFGILLAAYFVRAGALATIWGVPEA
jgi:hypothetical protein